MYCQYDTQLHLHPKLYGADERSKLLYDLGELVYAPLPEAPSGKANAKHAFIKIPKGRKENSSPSTRGKEGRVSAFHRVEDQLQEAQKKGLST